MAETDTPDTRFRRLRMRSWRRGMKEMDLILGPFADGPLRELDAAECDIYETLLTQNDQELYRWITARLSGQGGETGPAEFAPLLDRIAAHASGRFTASGNG